MRSRRGTKTDSQFLRSPPRLLVQISFKRRGCGTDTDRRNQRNEGLEVSERMGIRGGEWYTFIRKGGVTPGGTILAVLFREEGTQRTVVTTRTNPGEKGFRREVRGKVIRFREGASGCQLFFQVVEHENSLISVRGMYLLAPV